MNGFGSLRRARISRQERCLALRRFTRFARSAAVQLVYGDVKGKAAIEEVRGLEAFVSAFGVNSQKLDVLRPV
jgi:peptide deformylase